ncbi:hypothetical protein DEU56DRAFT_906464 [Suillus clintonianus]|uniref:uncharacterized protein n=1 Tax=Suillus clintonianus TaxID=1904413 RepID=UPI001B873BE4|nr:uncharacterized protein DEU56DRAFT_906464 [Suillus clintonianus]KAG2156300.1 hypothetical protein DEU56DRAFT_906464 [Suillus clintonianus]
MPAIRSTPQPQLWVCQLEKWDKVLCCNVLCDKTFVRKADFARHQNVHTKIKPHICGVCHKGFAQKSGLTTHHNIHTKRRPYVCNIGTCKKAFSDPSSCSRHRKETHTDSAYQCPRCSTRIKRRGAFTKHIVTCKKNTHLSAKDTRLSTEELIAMASSHKNESQESNFHFMPPQVADAPYCPPSETSLPGVTEKDPAHWPPAPRPTSNYQMSVPEYGGASGVADGMYAYSWPSELGTGRSISPFIPAPLASTCPPPPTHIDDFIFDAGYNGHLQPNDMFSPSPYASVSPSLPPLLDGFTDCFGSRMRSMSSSPATCSNSALGDHLDYSLLDHNVPNPYLLFNNI